MNDKDFFRFSVGILLMAVGSLAFLFTENSTNRKMTIIKKQK